MGTLSLPLLPELARSCFNQWTITRMRLGQFGACVLRGLAPSASISWIFEPPCKKWLSWEPPCCVDPKVQGESIEIPLLGSSHPPTHLREFLLSTLTKDLRVPTLLTLDALARWQLARVIFADLFWPLVWCVGVNERRHQGLSHVVDILSEEICKLRHSLPRQTLDLQPRPTQQQFQFNSNPLCTQNTGDI